MGNWADFQSVVADTMRASASQGVGSTQSSAYASWDAKRARISVVASGVGAGETLDIVIEGSADGTTFYPIVAMDQITADGNYSQAVDPISARYLRLNSQVQVGAITWGATIEKVI